MTKKATLSAAQADNDGVIEASPPLFRTAYGPKLLVQLYCDPAEDRTQQSFKDECDINNIMARYLKTGQLPQSSGEPVYLDTTAIDFQAAQDLVARTRGEFSRLSAEERDSYGNSPELWLEAMAEKAEQEAQDALDAEEQAAAAAAARASPQGDPGKPAGSPGEPVKA